MIVAGRFTGRVAVVTGAARGIGRASAERLGAEGATVALVDIDEPELARAVEELSADGLAAEGWSADVSSEVEVGKTVAAIHERFGRIDVLHANAGVLLAARVEDESLEHWERTLAVNFTGIFLSCRAVIPHMQKEGRGAIVTTGSISGMVAEPSYLGYCTSKAAVNHMTRQIALDQAGNGIRANAVCPGWVDTSFNEPLLRDLTPEEVDAAVRSSVPLGRQGRPDEIAAAVAFLASDEAGYITGHCLVVDGGYTIV